ncbi:hypothetical protein ACSBQY_10845, partial [Micrococcus lylae]|uniref:hypothetical protein n=1 Tax=Micrococcus lylae TaxID=1273 RepID=UPI003EB7AFFF
MDSIDPTPTRRTPPARTAAPRGSSPEATHERTRTMSYPQQPAPTDVNGQTPPSAGSGERSPK